MLRSGTSAANSLALRVGDIVEVRSQDEILATLDERGELGSLPLMPEMLAFCGRQFTVDKVANKACDTITQAGLRRMENAVHLAGVRCDGSAHGGCQNACLIYWKEAWLTRRGDADRSHPSAQSAARVTLPMLNAATRKAPGPDGEELFSCQATQLNEATTRQPFLDPKQYLVDFRSGNANLFWIVRAFLVGVFNRLQARSAKVLPRRLQFRGGRRWPFVEGKVRGRTPSVELGLEPGDRVRIKSKEEIEATLNADLRNRGMGFDGEMARFCGREATVARRVQRVIDEKTSRMVQLKNPCIVLEGLVCEGAYASTCPRQWICFWREAWLDRASDA